MITKNKIYFWTALALLFCLSFFIQCQFTLGPDMAWLMYGADHFMHGGRYGKDIFDGDPPMIFYFYMLPLLLNKYFYIQQITAFNICILGWCFLSLMLCHHLLAKIFNQRDSYIGHSLFWVTACVLLILPCANFGQREHLITILAFPYIFLNAIRQQNQPISNSLSFIIGLLAAFGFILKPPFLLVFGFLQLQLLISRGLKQIFLPESLAIILICSLYLPFIHWFYPELLTQVLPMSYKLYYANTLTFDRYTLNAVFILIVFIFSFSLLLYKSNPYRKVVLSISLAECGFIIAYFSHGSPTYFYRLYPAFSTAIVLATLNFILYLKYNLPLQQKHFTWKIYLPDILILSSFGFMAYAIPLFIVGFEIHDTTRKKIEIFESPISRFIMQQNPATRYYFISSTVYPYTLFYYAQMHTMSRFYFMWWVPEFKKLDKKTAHKYHHWIAQMMIEDLMKKPDLVLIDDYQRGSRYQTKPLHFDYLAFLKSEANFNAAWQPYHYLTKVGHFTIYRRE